MITTEILDLLEITRKLVNSKAELDKKYFEQFIAHAWDLFSKIHENYKSSFQKYFEFAESDEYDSKILIEKLRYDSLQTQDFRTELVEIVMNFPTAKFKAKENYLFDFSASIAYYFSVVNDFKFSSANRVEFEPNTIENIYRFSSIIELSRKGDPDREQSKIALRRAIQEFQSRYSKVASAYYKLRRELLS